MKVEDLALLDVWNVEAVFRFAGYRDHIFSHVRFFGTVGVEDLLKPESIVDFVYIYQLIIQQMKTL